MPASIYLIFYSVSLQNAYGPQGRDHSLYFQCRILPLYQDLQTQLTRGTTTIFLQRRWWSLLDTFPNTSIVLRNTVDLYKGLHGRAERLISRCTAEIHNALSSLSVYPPFSSSLCRKIDCIDYFTDVYSIPFTFGSQKQRGFWEMRGVCDANQCCNANRCGRPLYSENIFQEVTELLKLASPAGHSTAR